MCTLSWHFMRGERVANFIKFCRGILCSVADPIGDSDTQQQGKAFGVRQGLGGQSPTPTGIKTGEGGGRENRMSETRDLVVSFAGCVGQEMEDQNGKGQQHLLQCVAGPWATSLYLMGH